MGAVSGQRVPRVLVVSADETVVGQVEAGLKSLGCQVWRVAGDKDGLQQALVQVPDMVVVDMVSVETRGMVLCRHLKAQGRTALVPLLGLCTVDQRQTMLDAGLDDYCVVPLLQEEVLRRVRLHLSVQPHLALASSYDAVAVPGEPALITGSRAMLVSAARRYVDEHRGSVPDGEAVAEALDVSPRRLSRAFQQEMGMTLFAYLRNERMARAQELLSTTALGITAIAREVGFTSAANFSTAFLAHCGMTPSAYRAQAEGMSPRRASGSWR